MKLHFKRHKGGSFSIRHVPTGVIVCIGGKYPPALAVERGKEWYVQVMPLNGDGMAEVREFGHFEHAEAFAVYETQRVTAG